MFIEIPHSWGAIHITSLVIMVALIVLGILFVRKLSDKNFRLLIGIVCISLWICEIIKLTLFTYYYEPYGEFKWYVFSFQFCSTILYVLPFIVLLKDSKIRDAFILFGSSFMLIAGILVMVYPETVWFSLWFVDFQTMFHHGMMVVLGILIPYYYQEKITHKNYLKAVIVFACFVALAIFFNTVMPLLIENFNANCFYISHRYTSSLPVLSSIQPLVPYPVFVLIYIIGFSIIGYIAFLINKLILKIK